MAKQKSSRISSNQFFTITVLAVSVLGLIFITSAAQKPTNTNSDASYCGVKPTWKFIDTTDYPTSVVYHLRLVNNCPGAKNYILKVIEAPSQPYKYPNWNWKFANGYWETPYEKQNVSGAPEVNLTVARPVKGDAPLAMPVGAYKYVVVKASLASNPDVYDTINLTYTVQNP